MKFAGGTQLLYRDPNRFALGFAAALSATGHGGYNASGIFLEPCQDGGDIFRGFRA